MYLEFGMVNSFLEVKVKKFENRGKIRTAAGKNTQKNQFSTPFFDNAFDKLTENDNFVLA